MSSFQLRCLLFLGALLAGAGGLGRVMGAEAPAFLEREVKLDHRYLNVPVKAGAPRRTISLLIDGHVVRAFEVELANAEPDFWAFTEVSAWQGRRAVIRLDAVSQLSSPEAQGISDAQPISPPALGVLRLTDEIVDAASLYHEPLRPQFHFTTRRGWLNDPNGLLYHAGEYHLFYQYQAFSMGSLNIDKAWGHAVSRDLVHWEELPVAIIPDENGAAWSGSTLVDTTNVAGFQTGTEPALLLFYTATGRSAMNPRPAKPDDFVQRLAYSNDRGRTWTKVGAPVLANITPLNRDPLVFWHAPSQRWVMVLYVGYPISNPGNQYNAEIFNSTDLKHWAYQSRIEGFFDCPELYELPLDGNAHDTRWIIHCANMKYRVGRFDGKTFTPETGLIDSHKGDVGESEYAPQIFRNSPDARTVQLGWLYNATPGTRQLMTMPCDLSLVTTADGPRLRWEPVPEIEHLHGPVRTWANLPLAADARPVECARGRHLDFQAEIQAGDAREVEINIQGIPLVLHTRSRELTVRGYALPVALKEGRLALRFLLDETSLELFADGGLVYLPLSIPGNRPGDAITVSARGGTATLTKLDIAGMKSMWPRTGTNESGKAK